MDLLTTDVVTGKQTGLAKTARTALRALGRARVPFSVIGATALAVRGFPRMTRNLNVFLALDQLQDGITALAGAGFRVATQTGVPDDPEAMVVCVDPASGVEVDLLGASGEPETRVIAEATRAKVFGIMAPVATLEHLLLLYLYSNQPRHLGDFATIVQSGKADVAAAGRALAEIHPEMRAEWKRRVDEARTPKPSPPRPPKRRTR